MTNYFSLNALALPEIPKLSEGCQQHLEEALRAEDTRTKNYHIRQVLQVCGCEDVPEDIAKKGLSEGAGDEADR